MSLNLSAVVGLWAACCGLWATAYGSWAMDLGMGSGLGEKRVCLHVVNLTNFSRRLLVGVWKATGRDLAVEAFHHVIRFRYR